ncbi:MAG: hypothetical protein M0P57_01080 [Syntrophales bacterium]|jgi:hypothetical protein|nr:hypothetical protein [Syntrophales bacterium]MDY0045243.1 hypothetical protein [Syntrophales bacterium]
MFHIGIRAGENVYKMIMNDGVQPDSILTYIGPAVGPRWLVASGFDLSLLNSGMLGNKYPVQLIGASAGALRFAAWVQPEPEKSYMELINSYISMIFGRKESSKSILDTLQWLIDSYIEDGAIPFALANRRYRLSVITARAKHLAASEVRLFQFLGLAFAGSLNVFNPMGLNAFFQRILFHSGALPPPSCMNGSFSGLAVALNEANFKSALLASSAVPLAAAGVRNIFGAPRGIYRDGGMVDYHFNQNYGRKGKSDVVLMFHHEARLIPSWFDRYLKYRKPSSSMTENLLLIHPTEDFVKRLPGGKIPTRRDFYEFADNPPERIKRWKDVVRESEHLGEEFIELLQANKLKEVTVRI